MNAAGNLAVALTIAVAGCGGNTFEKVPAKDVNAAQKADSAVHFLDGVGEQPYVTLSINTTLILADGDDITLNLRNALTGSEGTLTPYYANYFLQRLGDVPT